MGGQEHGRPYRRYGTVRGRVFWYKILFGTKLLLVRYVVRILVRYVVRNLVPKFVRVRTPYVKKLKNDDFENVPSLKDPIFFSIFRNFFRTTYRTEKNPYYVPYQVRVRIKISTTYSSDKNPDRNSVPRTVPANLVPKIRTTYQNPHWYGRSWSRSSIEPPGFGEFSIS